MGLLFASIERDPALGPEALAERFGSPEGAPLSQCVADLLRVAPESVRWEAKRDRLIARGTLGTLRLGPQTCHLTARGAQIRGSDVDLHIELFSELGALVGGRRALLFGPLPARWLQLSWSLDEAAREAERAFGPSARPTDPEAKWAHLTLSPGGTAKRYADQIRENTISWAHVPEDLRPFVDRHLLPHEPLGCDPRFSSRG